jgi:hypothetical protein
MTQLIDLLTKIKSNVKIIMIYLAEAHANDVWPLGFDIKQPKILEERHENCQKLLKRLPALK